MSTLSAPPQNKPKMGKGGDASPVTKSSTCKEASGYPKLTKIRGKVSIRVRHQKKSLPFRSFLLNRGRLRCAIARPDLLFILDITCVQRSTTSRVSPNRIPVELSYSRLLSAVTQRSCSKATTSATVSWIRCSRHSRELTTVLLFFRMKSFPLHSTRRCIGNSNSASVTKFWRPWKEPRVA